MPSTTTRLALPIPVDTDPFADGALATRNLGNSLDDFVPAKARRGHTVATTDASGDLTITHGLGATPTAVVVSSGISAGGHVVAAHTFTSTTFKVRDRVSTTGAVVASTAGIIVDWIAFA